MVGTRYQEHKQHLHVVSMHVIHSILHCPTVVSICSLQTTPPSRHLPGRMDVLTGMSPIVDLLPHQ